MASNRTTHNSYWLEASPLRTRYPEIIRREQTQIAILGGGITGLSAALELLQRGYDVTVLEALTIGAGTTGGSTGHLDAHPEQGPHKMVEQLGIDAARLLVDARRQAIDTIERRADAASDFRRIPAYQYTESPTSNTADDSIDEQAGDPAPRNCSRHELQQDFEAARQLGFEVEWSEQVPLPGAGFGYRIEQMARMNSHAYVQHLAELVIAQGGKIFENSLANGPMGEQPNEIEVGQGSIEFEHVICAVHCNYSDVLRTYFQTPPYQSYVAAVRVANPPPDALYWDKTNPYYYTRRAHSNDPDLLIIGGCDKRTGAHCSKSASDGLMAYITARYEVREVVGQWSAELFEPVDHRPIIGLLPGKKNVWIATGLSGVGLTWGTAAGQLLAEQIVGKQSPLDELVTPSRFSLDALGTMVAEQATAAADYVQRIVPASRFNAEELQVGEGKVGVENHQHTAACRDATGCIHRHNPICPHMGGVLQWNAAEQSWDCPVHGGRFAADGTRIYGPPNSDLVEPGAEKEE